MSVQHQDLNLLHLIIILSSVIASVGSQGSRKGSKALSELVEELFNDSRYNSRSRPGADTGEPLPVYININVNDISTISEMRMEYSATLYLRQVWKDGRLAFKNYSRNVTLHHKQFERMWTPDVFIRNLKAGQFHTITVPNRLIRLSPDGTILYSQRLTLTLACDMNLSKYPMDTQACKIEFGSYAYTTDDLIFLWRTDALAVEVNDNINLPEYELKSVSHDVCTKNLSSTGSFPCLIAYFHLERRLRAYVLSTFLPSLLVVLLSWVSFWIDLDSVPARISLGILTMLTITTQSSGHLRGMPAVSFTKAIDVWMATCLVFVFGSFIEYSVVNVIARREKLRNAKAAAAAAQAQAAGNCGPSTSSYSRSNHSQSTVVSSNYSPYRLFKRPSGKERGFHEIQETIPLTNVSTPHRDYTHIGPGDYSPGRHLYNYGGDNQGHSGLYPPHPPYASGSPIKHRWDRNHDGRHLESMGNGGWEIEEEIIPGKVDNSCCGCNCCCFGPPTRRWRTKAAAPPPPSPLPQHLDLAPKYSQALMVDVISRVVFPATFFVFNLVYWPYYLL